MVPEDMVRALCKARGISMATLRSKRRWPQICRVRHEAMWLLSEATELSTTEIARIVGCRNHTSVISGRDKIARLVAKDARYGHEIERCATETNLERNLRLAREINEMRADLERREREFLKATGQDPAAPLSDEAGVGCGRAA